jgi:hypothetical protein
MQVESVLVGVIAASLVMFLWNKACDYRDYVSFRDWCDENDVTKADIDNKSIRHFYTMWRLSQIEGVEIVRHGVKEDGDSREDKPK